MIGIVDGDQSSLAIGSLPTPSDEAVGSPVAIPGRRAIDEAPSSVPNGRLPEHRKKTVVELLQQFLSGLDRRTDQVRRDVLASTLELSLMEEPQAR